MKKELEKETAQRPDRQDSNEIYYELDENDELVRSKPKPANKLVASGNTEEASFSVDSSNVVVNVNASRKGMFNKRLNYV